MGFEWVVEEMFMRIEGRVCRLKHYPYALKPAERQAAIREGRHIDDRYEDRRPPRVKGEILIHGHTHAKTKRNGSQIHVGVDAWNYAPAPFEEVAKIIAKV